MSDKQRAALSGWVELLYKIGVPLGLAAIFFLRSSFATKEELESVAVRISAMERALAVMAEQNLTNERQDKRIEDHEARIRALEFAR